MNGDRGRRWNDYITVYGICNEEAQLKGLLSQIRDSDGLHANP